jgi:hypothetical protein
MPTNKELTTKNVPSVHWQADFCGRQISAPSRRRPLELRNHQIYLPTCSKRDIFTGVEESSLWLDFDDFCGNLPKSPSVFPGGMTIA